MAAFFWDKHHDRSNPARRWGPPRYWRFRKLLRKVVASLSDNQLVTGLALSISLIYRESHDTKKSFTTVYTYNLVVFMLMLTLIAHACALFVCDHYFTRKKKLGSILRIVAISAVLALTTFIFTAIIRRGDWPMGSSANVSLPAKCYVDNCTRAVYLGSAQQHLLRFGSITLHILVWVVYGIAVFYQFIKFSYTPTLEIDEDKEKEPGFRDQDHNLKWRLFNGLRLFFPALTFSGAAWALWGSRNFDLTAPGQHPAFTNESQNTWTFGQIVPFVQNYPLYFIFFGPEDELKYSLRYCSCHPCRQSSTLMAVSFSWSNLVPIGVRRADKQKKDAYDQPGSDSEGKRLKNDSVYTRCRPDARDHEL